jgi:hypothetical protein
MSKGCLRAAVCITILLVSLVRDSGVASLSKEFYIII